MNIAEYGDKRPVSVARPDESVYEIPKRRIERPGQWFQPTVATFTAAGGRLLLAAAIELIHQAGGEYVLGDTDSLFVAATRSGGSLECPGAPDGTLRLLSWSEVDEIRARFDDLNPYNLDVSILELEPENFNADDEQQTLWCWSIAAKRYALFTRQDNDIEIIGRSEHGLGHLINPISPDTDWITEWWDLLVRLGLGLPIELPSWFDRPAIGKLSIGSIHELDTFAAHNEGLEYADQVRPGGFLLMAHVDPFAAHIGPRCLISAYDPEPGHWMEADWFDRSAKNSPAYRIRTDHRHLVVESEVPVKTLGNHFDAYRHHPESKAAGTNGLAARADSRGVLRHRKVEATRIERIGKESNRLTEHPVIGPRDRAIPYPDPTCHRCGEPLTGRQVKWCSQRCRLRQWRRAR